MQPDIQDIIQAFVNHFNSKDGKKELTQVQKRLDALIRLDVESLKVKVQNN